MDKDSIAEIIEGYARVANAACSAQLQRGALSREDAEEIAATTSMLFGLAYAFRQGLKV